MFTVIYSFEVKSGQVQDFENTWRELTLLITKYGGSLGSRLHKQKELCYISYAQWPDRNSWKNSGNKLPEISNVIRKKLKDSCIQINTLFELDVVQDLFIKQ